MTAKGKKAKDRAAVNTESAPDGLDAPVWSLISFEKRIAKKLTYAEAEQKLAKLEAEKITGLCIVSDEAAARISKRISR